MKRRACAILFSCLAVAGLAGAETPSLDTIKASVESAWKAVESFSADVMMDFLYPVGAEPLALTGNGTMDYLRVKDKDKYRFKVITKVPEPFAMEMKLDVLYTDDTVYTTAEVMGQKHKQQGKPSLEQNALPPGGLALIEAMEAQMVLTPQPDASVGEHPVFVIEGKPREATLPFSKALFYIDKGLGIQRKSEIYQQDGTVGVTMTFDNIRLNSNPSSSLFVPEP
jgi:outer membrane lipoprotein-sorting protein